MLPSRSRCHSAIRSAIMTESVALIVCASQATTCWVCRRSDGCDADETGPVMADEQVTRPDADVRRDRGAGPHVATHRIDHLATGLGSGCDPTMLMSPTEVGARGDVAAPGPAALRCPGPGIRPRTSTPCRRHVTWSLSMKPKSSTATHRGDHSPRLKQERH